MKSRTRSTGSGDLFSGESLSVATWNVNGIRARALAFERWVAINHPDIVCLQEIKAHPEQVPVHLRDLDAYSSIWHGAKGGYSGVSIHVRKHLGEPAFSVPHFDQETRIVQASIDGLAVINVYTPLGQKSYRQKLEFLDDLIRYIDALRYEGQRVLLCGDLNIAHTNIDVHPELYEEGRLCLRDDERAKLDLLRERGMIDVFRYLHPAERSAYTWWPYFGGARLRNVGWRLDYFFASEDLLGAVRTCRIHREEASSDHSPVVAEFGQWRA
jgi:exodeoxyribonuclease III